MRRYAAIGLAMLAGTTSALGGEPAEPTVTPEPAPAAKAPAIEREAPAEPVYISSFWSLSRVRADAAPELGAFRAAPPRPAHVMILRTGRDPYAWMPFVRELPKEWRMSTADSAGPADSAYIPGTHGLRLTCPRSRSLPAAIVTPHDKNC